MAISAPTELTHDHLASSGSTIASTAATFTSGRLYIVATGGSGVTARTASSLAGASGTWTEVNGGTDSSWSDGTNWATTLFWATDATGAAQQLTTTFSGSWSLSRYIHVFEIVTGFDTTGLVVQSVAGNQAPAATQATCNLADSAASGNMRLAYFVHRINEALTAANSGTLVGQRAIASPAVSKALWYYDGDTTSDPSVTWATSTRGAGYMGIELKATAGGASQALAGTIAGVSTATADVVVAHSLDGTSAATSAASADLVVAHPLAATVTAISTVTADLAVVHPLAGTIAAQSAVTSDLVVAHPLEATVGSVSTVAADLTVTTGGTTQALAGTVTAAISLTADLTVAHDLAGTVAAQSAVTSDLAVAHTLEATVAAASTVASDVAVAHSLAALVVIQSVLTAALTVAGPVSATVDLHAVFREHTAATFTERSSSTRHREHVSATFVEDMAGRYREHAMSSYGE